MCHWHISVHAPKYSRGKLVAANHVTPSDRSSGTMSANVVMCGRLKQDRMKEKPSNPRTSER